MDCGRRAVEMPAGHRKKPGAVIHLDVALFVAACGHGTLYQNMYAGAAGRHFGVRVEVINDGLRPVLNGAALRIPAMIEVNAGVGVLRREDKANPATTVGIFIRVLPQAQGSGETLSTLHEGTPGCGDGRAGLGIDPALAGDLGELHLPGLLIELLDTTPEDPLTQVFRFLGIAPRIAVVGPVYSAFMRHLPGCGMVVSIESAGPTSTPDASCPCHTAGTVRSVR